MNGRLYLERLSERDLAFLVSACGGGARGLAEGVAGLRAEPVRIEELVGRSEVFDALFAPWSQHPFAFASPFLTFSVLLAGTERELESMPFVREWVGPSQRVPVFEVESLRRFLDDSARRVFLAEVLSSYTHVSSGVVWVHGRRGWSRRRFNELDPARLVTLLDAVPAASRPAVYRRLGDLALFLTGVFPDSTAQRTFAPVQVERLERTLAEALGASDETHDQSPGAIGLLERLGRRSYRTVLAAMPEPRSALTRALGEVAEHFEEARRVLNVLTDTHLFPVRGDWFPRT
jgi:hypothetical protein